MKTWNARGRICS